MYCWGEQILLNLTTIDIFTNKGSFVPKSDEKSVEKMSIAHKLQNVVLFPFW